ncbi:hypothetical protein [Streptomyces cacaoi]|uniref:hypothetical protein n=2 Tax=Streptomyces cacaoi TaxID=1898 RepID=UPI00117FC35E|nr:hypothetical protein [Streptomyces cacaoi]NNG84904.1 hypothetical protein [Streptomyces cacaoi]
MRAVGEPWGEGAVARGRRDVRRGGGVVRGGRRGPGEGRRPGVRPGDVLAVLALVAGIVLGVGSWRTYATESAGREGAEDGADRGPALVKPKEVIRPVPAGASAHCAGARRPAGVARAASAPGGADAA